MDLKQTNAGAVGAMPAAPAGLVEGWFTDGDPLVPTPATVPGAHWFNQKIAEFGHLFAQAGITPDHEDLTQLHQAIVAVGGWRNVQHVLASDAGWTAPLAYPAPYLVELWGGGGGGCGAEGASGAGGGYAAKVLVLAANEAVPITIGAGGAAATYPSLAANGGTTMFGAYFSATGGAGGGAGAGDGGIGVGGDVNLRGGHGSDLIASGNAAHGGGGAFGGGPGGGVGNSTAVSGDIPGGGGGAEHNYGGSSNYSGPGGAGLVRIWYPGSGA